MDDKQCPYCGEIIKASAKKCRYCGEWLNVESAEDAPREEYAVAEVVAVGEMADASRMPATTAPQGSMTPAQPSPAGTTPLQATQINADGQPQQVIMPQIVINNAVSQNTEVNVDVENKSSSSSSGWLWFELLVVGGIAWGVWNFWTGVAVTLVLGIAIFIPVLGHIICIVLGAAVGLLAGMLAAAFGAPTWLAVLIGIILGVGAIGVNLNDRDAEDD